MSFYTSYNPLYDFVETVSSALDDVQDSLDRDQRQRGNNTSKKAVQGSNKGGKQVGSKKEDDSPASQGLLGALLNRGSSLFNGDNWDAAKLVPAMNIKENDDSYTLKVSAPGAEKDHISIDYNKKDNELIIKGEIPEDDIEEDDKGNLVHKEISTGKFERKLYLPSSIDGSKIKAGLSNGILTLQVPKPKEQDEGMQSISISDTIDL